MTTLNAIIGFGAATLASMMLIWVLYWQIEMAIEKKRSLAVPLFVTGLLGLGLIAVFYQAGMNWVNWASTADANQTTVATAIGTLVGLCVAGLVFKPQPKSADPPHVPIPLDNRDSLEEFQDALDESAAEEEIAEIVEQMASGRTTDSEPNQTTGD